MPYFTTASPGDKREARHFIAALYLYCYLLCAISYRGDSMPLWLTRLTRRMLSSRNMQRVTTTLALFAAIALA